MRQLFVRLRHLLRRRQFERELAEEMECHRSLTTGRAFGSMALAQDRARDVWLWPWLQSAGQDVRFAPLAALTIIAPVALGLGLMAMAFTLYSAFFLRDDAVPNASELVAVERWPRRDADALSFTRAQYEAMRRETSVFADAVAML